MNTKAEEDDRIDAEYHAAFWCDECNVSIGHGDCDHCLALGPDDDWGTEEDTWP